MESNSGRNFKDKFRTLMNRTSRLGSDSSPNSPGAKTTLSDFDDYVKSGLTSAGDAQRRTSRTSAASLNRGRIQGPLTDFEEDQVLHGLEEVYLQDDTDFDPTAHELSKFPPNFDQAAVDVQRQRLLRQLKVVTKRAFGQILEKRPECNLEFENVKKLDDDLNIAIESVRKGRQGLLEARKKFTASSLGILAAYRRRQRAQVLLDNLVVISTFQRTDERLHQFLDEGDFPGAIQLLFEAKDAAKTYSHFRAIQQLSHNLQDTLELAEEQLDVALSKVCVDFKESTYARLQDAYTLLGKTETSMDQLQMHSASAVHNSAWNVVYGHVVLCQDDPDAVGEVTKKLYGDLCSQLHLTSLLPCLVDLCRSLCGIMQSYKSIYNWHVNQDSCGTQEYVLKKLSNGFPRIWQDVQTKVKILVTSNSVQGLSIDNFLKIIDTINMLIEVGRKFCSSESDSLQQSLKEQCLAYFNSYHLERLEELKMHLDNEGWALCPVKSSFKATHLREFRSISTIISTNQRSPRKSVQEYVSSVDDFVAPFENFLEESIMEEDFMLNDIDFSDDENDSEELKQDFIDEGDGGREEKKLEKGQVPIVTNTSLMLLRLCGKYLHLLQALEPISTEVFACMTNLLDFYTLTVFDIFTQDLNQVHNAVIKPRFQELINKMRKKFDMPILDANQSISSITNGISEIVDAEKLHGLADKVIAVESVIFAARQFVQFQHLLRCRDNQLVNIYYSETIQIIPDLRDPVYMTSCCKAVNAEVISQLMAKVAWDIRDVKSQHSQYVDILLRELQIFSIRLQSLGDHVYLSNEVQQSLWSMCSFACALLFVEGFSTAKKCSNEGRALMQLDYRHFVMKLERIAEIKPLPYQDHVVNYVKAYYIPEADLEQWVKIHEEYTSKQLMSLINSVAYSNNKTKQKLNQMVSEISGKISNIKTPTKDKQSAQNQK